MAQMPPFFSVIVPVFNGAATLSACLSAVFSQETSLPFEVIVVNDCSTDGSVAIAKGFPCRILDLQLRGGPGSARNRGAEEARGAMLLFCDCDCYLSSNWIERAHRYSKEQGIQSMRGITVKADNDGVVGLFRLWEVKSRFPHKDAFVDAVSTDNYAVDRLLFLQLGGFPHLCVQEDMLFGYKLMNHGIATLFSTELRITQRYRNTIKDYLQQQYTWFRDGLYVRGAIPGVRTMRHAYPSKLLAFDCLTFLSAIVNAVGTYWVSRCLYFAIVSLLLLGLANIRLLLTIFWERRSLVSVAAGGAVLLLRQGCWIIAAFAGIGKWIRLKKLLLINLDYQPGTLLRSTRPRESASSLQDE